MDMEDITNTELLDAINKGFTAVEEQIREVKHDVGLLTMRADRIKQKVDGISNRLDAEVLRRTDEYAIHERRIKHLEKHLVSK